MAAAQASHTKVGLAGKLCPLSFTPSRILPPPSSWDKRTGLAPECRATFVRLPGQCGTGEFPSCLAATLDTSGEEFVGNKRINPIQMGSRIEN